MQTVTLSYKGSKSETNEDAYLSLPSKGFFVLADGVGGGPNGDFASRSAVDTLYDELTCSGVSESAILKAIDIANESIFNAGQAEGKHGMATTLAASWISGDRAFCFNVGDSRVYRLSAGTISQLTRDHTKQVQKAVNVVKQVVTNALGIRPSVKVEVTGSSVLPGDVIFLATDGITDLLSEELMLEVLSSDQLSLVDKAQALISESERRGGRDDKTVILAVVG